MFEKIFDGLLIGVGVAVGEIAIKALSNNETVQRTIKRVESRATETVAEIRARLTQQKQAA